MWTPSQCSERIRAKIARLFVHHRERLGCAQAATRKVARDVGASPMWVHRIRGRYGSVKVQMHHWLNTLEAYAKAEIREIRFDLARFKERFREVRQLRRERRAAAVEGRA